VSSSYGIFEANRSAAVESMNPKKIRPREDCQSELSSLIVDGQCVSVVVEYAALPFPMISHTSAALATSVSAKPMKPRTAANTQYMAKDLLEARCRRSAIVSGGTADRNDDEEDWRIDAIARPLPPPPPSGSWRLISRGLCVSETCVC
jgi:hypothetical protein